MKVLDHPPSQRDRSDLYYRVRVLEIDVPRLAARGGEEIERLATHFADLYARRYARPEPRFAPGALSLLRSHAWPGNVRELEHWIESALVLAPDGVLRADRFPVMRGGREDEPDTAHARIALGLTLDAAGDAYIRATVDACGGNQSEAARRLGVSRNTVARALRSA